MLYGVKITSFFASLMGRVDEAICLWLVGGPRRVYEKNRSSKLISFIIIIIILSMCFKDPIGYTREFLLPAEWAVRCKRSRWCRTIGEKKKQHIICVGTSLTTRFLTQMRKYSGYPNLIWRSTDTEITTFF